MGGGRPYNQFPGGVSGAKPSVCAVGAGMFGVAESAATLSGAVHAIASNVAEGTSGRNSHWQSEGFSLPHAHEGVAVSFSCDALACSSPWCPSMAGQAHACPLPKPTPAPTKKTSAQKSTLTIRQGVPVDASKNATTRERSSLTVARGRGSDERGMFLRKQRGK